jgi:nucleotide-binding universal stress UspA family protein
VGVRAKEARKGPGCGLHPELSVERDFVAGDALRELRAAAQFSTLLVLGSRGRGGFGGLALGPVSLRLAGSPARPLVIVPKGHAAGSHAGATTVGIETHGCIEALRYGFEHARRMGGGVRVVQAWSPYPAHSSGAYVSDTDVVARNAMSRIWTWIKAADTEGFGIRPEVAVLCGRPGAVLVEESRSAGILVVAAHRHHHLPGTPGLGATLHHLLTEAGCPVAVVPAS